MREWIRGLSWRTEISLTMLMAFGWFVFTSLTVAVFPSPAPALTQTDLRWLLWFELSMLVPVTAFLALRGWRWQDICPAPEPRDAVFTPLLVVATVLLGGVAMLLASGLGLDVPDTEVVVPVQGGLGWATVVAVSLVNGFYEEALVCGYLMTALNRGAGSPWVAIHASTLLRLAYHLYQGSLAAVSIIPTGLLFAWFYARTGRLWPLIVAHVLLDIWALGAHA